VQSQLLLLRARFQLSAQLRLGLAQGGLGLAGGVEVALGVPHGARRLAAISP
jgi:hypothetical protein